MINSVQIENFGPLAKLDWQNLGPINLVIGENGCGKSFLLKALYASVRTLEDYKRGNNPDSLERILENKLYWSFQYDHAWELTANEYIPLSTKLTLNQQEFSYSLHIVPGFEDRYTYSFDIKNSVTPVIYNSIFLPAKEVLSIYANILTSRQRYKEFGFDDTYFDLAIALQHPVSYFLDGEAFLMNINKVGIKRELENIESNRFNLCRSQLEDHLGGYIEFSDLRKKWIFHDHKTERLIPINLAAEGVRKIGVFEILLGNGYLSEQSIIFIDEPEANLHPTAISQFLDIITILAQHGLQIFIASHSYFVIKKLFLIAKEQNISIPLLSNESNAWHSYNLRDEMPENPIIDESIRLYEAEVDLAFR